MTRRLDRAAQKRVEEAILSNDALQATSGRLMGSGAWPAFEAWLDSENVADPEVAADVLLATMRFAAFLVVGLAEEFCKSTPALRDGVERMLVYQLRRLWDDHDAGKEKTNVDHP